jgi:hypothetical protein
MLILMDIGWRDRGSVSNVFSMSLECSLTLQGMISLDKLFNDGAASNTQFRLDHEL